MKVYKNPEMEILNIVANDVLNGSGNAPDIDPLEQPNGTPSVSLDLTNY